MYIVLEQSDVFPFGKYEDKLLSEVIKYDASYLVWFHNTVDDYRIENIMDALSKKGVQDRQWKESRRDYSGSYARRSKPYNHHQEMAAEYWRDIYGHGPH